MCKINLGMEGGRDLHGILVPSPYPNPSLYEKGRVGGEEGLDLSTCIGRLAVVRLKACSYLMSEGTNTSLIPLLFLECRESGVD